MAGPPSTKKEIRSPPVQKVLKKFEITIGIIFYAWDLYALFFYREFSSPTWKKSLPSKVPIPTQNPDLTQVSRM